MSVFLVIGYYLVSLLLIIGYYLVRKTKPIKSILVLSLEIVSIQIEEKDCSSTAPAFISDIS